MPDTNPKPWSETAVVGKALPKIDGRERLAGVAKYTLDQNLPDMLYAATLRCPHAHARVLKVDIGRAKTMPGVREDIELGHYSEVEREIVRVAKVVDAETALLDSATKTLERFNP